MSKELATKNKSAIAAPKTATLKGMLTSDAMRAQFAAALPKHLTADRFVRVALTAITKTPKLQQCSQSSFFQALLTLSQFGLEPDGRNAHLIPFENRKAGTVDCQLIIDYKGLVDLAMRSGVVSCIHSDVICENDEFEYDLGEIKRHKIDFRNDRGSAYAVYAMCKFKDGSVKTEVMSVQDVESIRARSRAGNSGPWVTDWREMAKKTVFRRLSKWLPLSPEFREAVDSDDDVIDVKVVKTSANMDEAADRIAGSFEDEEAVNEDDAPFDDEPKDTLV